MPRHRIDIADAIEYLSILDENGNLDASLEPDLEDELLLKLYRFMLLGRRFDERLLSLQRQGRIGTFPPISGQEAAHVGPVAVLKDSDWMVPAFRETAAELWRGRSMESVILANAGYSEGATLADPGNNLPMSIPVGSQMLHAVGLAWAARYRGRNDVVMTFFGDGATSEGDFHEAMNFAGVFQTPVIFVCQNNQWAISIPRSMQTRSTTIAQKALAYGMPGIQVDGNDVLAMVAAASEAVSRARAGEGPTLIEAVTYRMSVHTTADDPKRYRSDEEVDAWREKDPISRFRTYLHTRGLLPDDRSEELEQEIADEIQSSVDAAETAMASLGDPMDMFEHSYAERPPNLEEQRETLARYLREVKPVG
ncbi:Branched-chain alpha-keto acid dehydrogenase, E1 component, alpha subunit (EC [Olavius algarvensis associated proteobacterium Delta 3]|nr:Branched-chain alpha-keto acid dehydrogenase, E1 component, alpha subunit (EC [Olavius algarvensis associated proteobacterium Delta 3]CAB5153595.1 Branched-chain alpha-keto acid dehydrogenase, E1 component, alpha subunit (EC [Olavius algarvensis associated proteobacterium Delta 3]